MTASRLAATDVALGVDSGETTMHRAFAFGLVVVVSACRSTSGPIEATPATAVSGTPDAGPMAIAIDASVAAPTTSAATAGAAPPPIDRVCTRDSDCAVARIEPSGPNVCCAACATTPGTRRWHEALQLFCGGRVSPDCPALACPLGPTRAVCDRGTCTATWTGVDGGPKVVPFERRCLPALACSAWSGCADVQGNDQDGWFVVEAPGAAPGSVATLVAGGASIVATGRACASDGGVPPAVPATHRCVFDGLHCRKSP